MMQLEVCPGTAKFNDCVFPAIPTVQGQSIWSCSPGFFCLSPGQSEKCPSGMFCPPDSQQPMFCPSKYFCSPDGSEITRCPSGYSCITGTIQPRKCNFASCPEGTDVATRIPLLAFILILVSCWFLIHQLFKRYINYTPENYIKKDIIISHAHPLSSISNRLEYVIRLDDVGYVVQNKMVLSGITARFKSARLIGILGPSGSGKSTLLNLLGGRTRSKIGKIIIDGVNPNRLPVGFVPQDDISIPELTVKQTLFHYGMTKYSDVSMVEGKLEELLETLQLQTAEHTRLGSIENRGISGGQKRRVNIGIELMQDPSILLLDEPTSGLDSTIAFDICSILRKWVDHRRALVIAVIHCPSVSAFNLFDDIMLLDCFGKLVYFGSRQGLSPYLENLGFACQKDKNPASFSMDIILGRIRSSRYSYLTHENLSEFWLRYSGNEANHDILPSKHIYEFPLRSRIHLHPSLSSIQTWFRQFFLFIKRSSNQTFADERKLFLGQLIHVASGLFISLACKDASFIRSLPSSVCDDAPYELQWNCRMPIDSIATSGVFICLGIMYVAISATSSTFGNEMIVAKREHFHGIYSSAYFLGKIVSDIPRLLSSSILFTLSFLTFYQYQSSILSLWILFLCLYADGFAMGYFLSIVQGRSNIGLSATAFTLAWSLALSGVVPSIQSIQQNTPDLMFLWTISGPRWMVEGFWITEVGASDMKPEDTGNFYVWTDYNLCCMCMIIIAIVWSFFSFVCFKIRNKL